MRISLVYLLLIILTVLIAKGNYEAYKGLSYMLDPESINPVEGAAIVLGTALIYGAAWVPFIGVSVFMRKKLNKVFVIVSSIPLLIMGFMVAMVFTIG